MRLVSVGLEEPARAVFDCPEKGLLSVLLSRISEVEHLVDCATWDRLMWHAKASNPQPVDRTFRS